MENIKKDVLERFVKYVKIHTTSEYDSDVFPSTAIQLDFAKMLVEECKNIGLSDVDLDKNGYVTATLKGNVQNSKKTVGFIAHMDTSPDCSGENVSPILHENYNGEDLILDGISITVEEFPSILEYKGDTIITANGKTLLGADDKAGIAEILTAMKYLIDNPDIKHGDIRVGFTPDEEVGKGVDFFDVEHFGADFAYTLDGGEIGELQYENFNAARAIINIKGKSVHTGHAKNIMINSSLVALEFASLLPSDETPATTENYEGFFHLCSISGGVESTEIRYIIRDFDDANFRKRKDLLIDIVKKMNQKFDNCVKLQIVDEYSNMNKMLKDSMDIVDTAKKAMEQAGVEVNICPIRGGTDGARLSYMGLPCPNIFAGGHNFHGPYEYVPLNSMVKAVKVIVNIAKLCAE